jgi:hypothetical protein
VYRDAAEMLDALQAAGFDDARVESTGRFFVLASGKA